MVDISDRRPSSNVERQGEAMGGLRWLGKQSAGDRGSNFKHFPVTRALRLDNNVMTGPLMGRGVEADVKSAPSNRSP